MNLITDTYQIITNSNSKKDNTHPSNYIQKVIINMISETWYLIWKLHIDKKTRSNQHTLSNHTHWHEGMQSWLGNCLVFIWSISNMNECGLLFGERITSRCCLCIPRCKNRELNCTSETVGSTAAFTPASNLETFLPDKSSSKKRSPDALV